MRGFLSLKLFVDTEASVKFYQKIRFHGAGPFQAIKPIRENAVDKDLPHVLIHLPITIKHTTHKHRDSTDIITPEQEPVRPFIFRKRDETEWRK